MAPVGTDGAEAPGGEAVGSLARILVWPWQDPLTHTPGRKCPSEPGASGELANAPDAADSSLGRGEQDTDFCM